MAAFQREDDVAELRQRNGVAKVEGVLRDTQFLPHPSCGRSRGYDIVGWPQANAAFIGIIILPDTPTLPSIDDHFVHGFVVLFWVWVRRGLTVRIVSTVRYILSTSSYALATPALS
jgi:hypothetical protein